MKKFISGICLVAGFAVTGCALAADDASSAQASTATASTGLMKQEHNSSAEQKSTHEKDVRGGRPEGVSNPNALSTK
jgi:hypothetical protein